jgi:uncharacterized protein (TIGR02246 family)
MTEQDEIDQLLDAYAAAVRAKDAGALGALYDDDVRVFDLWARWSYEGAPAWRESVRDWFDSLGDEQVAVELDERRTLAEDGLAVATAFVTFRALSAEGEELRSMSNRFTWALRRGHDGTWRVVHEHTSAPVDPETSTVVLQR